VGTSIPAYFCSFKPNLLVPFMTAAITRFNLILFCLMLVDKFFQGERSSGKSLGFPALG